MARVSLARQLLSDTGLLASYSAVAVEGHAFENNGKVLLHVRNDSPTDLTVTVRTGYVRNGLKLADRLVTVVPGAAVFIGPLDTTIYNQTDGGAGQVYVDYSSVEGVTVAALLMP